MAKRGTALTPGQFAKALNKFLVEVTYSITIDHSRTLKQMIAAGKYNYVNPGITAAHFPINGRGTVKTEIVLVHLGQSMSGDKGQPMSGDKAVRVRLEKMNLEPAKIVEGLAFGAKYPNVQREFPVVCLGSIWQDYGDRCVVVLDGRGTSRGLSLYDCDDWWHGDCRFAARQCGK